MSAGVIYPTGGGSVPKRVSSVLELVGDTVRVGVNGSDRAVSFSGLIQ